MHPTIDKDAAPEAWAMFSYELEDAAEALAALLSEMNLIEMEKDGFGEPELRVYLGHIYVHLNRAWQTRNATASAALDPTEEQREAWSRFPADLDPVG